MDFISFFGGGMFWGFQGSLIDGFNQAIDRGNSDVFRKL